MSVSSSDIDYRCGQFLNFLTTETVFKGLESQNDAGVGFLVRVHESKLLSQTLPVPIARFSSTKLRECLPAGFFTPNIDRHLESKQGVVLIVVVQRSGSRGLYYKARMSWRHTDADADYKVPTVAVSEEQKRKITRLGCKSQRTCERCPSKSNLRRCGRCQAVVYCSRDCQKDDWPQHKTYCRRGVLPPILDLFLN
uniref:MYND-type domain-containing protein n=1 Tax=viral metagenome TaxID=1070528 RepID=A0A6C0BQ00_9ZZZZ